MFPHSAHLAGDVVPFRAYLSKRISVENIDPAKLRLRYIPNLVAAPFETIKAYAELISVQTGSAPLGKALANWERDGWGTVKKEQQLTGLLLNELLAYQFASPVRWIEIQDLLFSPPPHDFERLVEFGPSSTLVGMAQRTHKLNYAKADLARGKRRVMLCHGKIKRLSPMRMPTWKKNPRQLEQCFRNLPACSFCRRCCTYCRCPISISSCCRRRRRRPSEGH